MRLLTCVVIALASAPSAAQMDAEAFERLMRHRTQSMRDLEEERELNEETLALLNREVMEHIAVDQLSADQIVRLKRERGFFGIEVTDTLLARLGDVGRTPDADGAHALAFRASLLAPMGRMFEARRTMGRVLTHPAFGEFMHDAAAGEFLQAMGAASLSFSADQMRDAYAALRRVPADASLGTVLGLRLALHHMAMRVDEGILDEHLRAVEHAASVTRQVRDGTDPADARAIVLLDEVFRYLDGRYARAELLDEPMPPLTVRWSSHGHDSLRAHDGKVRVLVFWTTWSQPCHTAFGRMQDLRARYFGDDRIAFVAVTSLQGRHLSRQGMLDTRADRELEMELMVQFIEDFSLTWEVVFTHERAFNPDYGVIAIPHMTIVDGDGRVRHNEVHPNEPIDELTARIDELLAELDASGD